MKTELQAIATILSLVNPAICAMMFTQIAEGQDRKNQFILATQAMLAIMTILIIAAFFGSHVLKLFGISLDAFSVAGGAVLAWIGFSMLTGKGATTSDSPTPSAAKGQESVSVAPLILFAASPGTITGVITISVSHTGLDVPVTALVAIVAVLAFTWIVLLMTSRFGGSSSRRSVTRDLVTRYMGLIVIAMGIQFALTGYRSFMAAG